MDKITSFLSMIERLSSLWID